MIYGPEHVMYKQMSVFVSSIQIDPQVRITAGGFGKTTIKSDAETV